MRRTTLLSLIKLSAAQLIVHVSANCECGYSVNSSTSPSYTVFTDLLETDFLHLHNLDQDFRWRRQEYNVTPKAARGPYGKRAQVSNVVANPVANKWNWAGPSVAGGDAGLQLWVRANVRNEMIGMGEIVGERTDILYGSFRVGAKMSNVPGSCAAFFWYRNDTQEIDMEFLSKQFSTTNNSVNLILQSPQSRDAGYDAQHTASFSVYPLPFSPDQQFHEYRFDWTPEKVSFLADGKWMMDMTMNAPTSPGYLILNHWSNGDPKWSGGPPAQDAVLTVSYVKAYFNSSDPARRQAFEEQCGNGAIASKRICQIPNQTVPPDPAGPDGNDTAHTFFFTQVGNQTESQAKANTTGSGSRSSGGLVRSVASMLTAMVLSVSLASAL